MYVLIVYVLGFLLSVQELEAFSLREGRHGGFTRLVLDVPGDTVLISHKILHPQKITMAFTGGICGALALSPKVHSTVLRSWTMAPSPSQANTRTKPTGCHVQFLFRNQVTLKRLFVLQNPRRLVVDIAKVLSLSSVKPPQCSLKKTVAHPVTTEQWERKWLNQIVPAEKPLKFFFHPLLLEKPFRPTIVLDAGHGGHDPGSISCKGNYEKKVTLAATKVIAEELRKAGRYHVVLTRRQDVFVPKRKRFSIARDAQADFLISIHADNHPSQKIRGLTLYTLSAKASDTEAARLSKQENKSDFLEDLDFKADTTQDVSTVLINIAQRSSKNTALILAKLFHASLLEKKVGKLMTLRSADLAVLKSPDTPSILMELGYLSNEKDEKLVRNTQYQKKLAQSLINALDKYFEKA